MVAKPIPHACICRTLFANPPGLCWRFDVSTRELWTCTTVTFPALSVALPSCCIGRLFGWNIINRRGKTLHLHVYISLARAISRTQGAIYFGWVAIGMEPWLLSNLPKMLRYKARQSGSSHNVTCLRLSPMDVPAEFDSMPASLVYLTRAEIVHDRRQTCTSQPRIRCRPPPARSKKQLTPEKRRTREEHGYKHKTSTCNKTTRYRTRVGTFLLDSEYLSKSTWLAKSPVNVNPSIL